jgi:hypothetical protein
MRADPLIYKDSVVVIETNSVFFKDVKYTREWQEQREEGYMKENELREDEHNYMTTAEFNFLSPCL